MKSTNGTSRRGFTLIELVVAIAVAGIVVTLGFVAYMNMQRAFHLQSRTASRLRTMIVMQQRIDRACSRLSIINRCSEREVAGVDGATGMPTVLRFDGARLLEGNDTIVRGLDRFAFTLEESREKGGIRDAVLLWEGTLTDKEWVGGAVSVRR